MGPIVRISALLFAVLPILGWASIQEAAAEQGDTVVGEGDLEIANLIFSPRVGYIYQGFYRVYQRLPVVQNGGMRQPTNNRSRRIAERMGADLHFAFRIGGAENTFEAAPLLSIYNNETLGDFAAMGIYFGYVYRKPVGKWMFNFGFGPRLAMDFGGDLDYGAELMGRLPVGFSRRIFGKFALGLEAAGLYGAVGLKASKYVRPIRRFEFGQTWGVDGALVLEWP